MNRLDKQCRLIAFGVITADMPSNKSLDPVVTESFTLFRKLNKSYLFLMQSYFAAS